MQPKTVIGCRLCLTMEPQRNYFSLEPTKEFHTVKTALSQEADFRKLHIYPNHICQLCKHQLRTFKLFKATALRNEKFIIQCQDSITKLGVDEAHKLFESNFKEAQGKVSDFEEIINKDDELKVQEDFGEEQGFKGKGEVYEKEGFDVTAEIDYDADIFERPSQFDIYSNKTIEKKVSSQVVKRKINDQENGKPQYVGDSDSLFKHDNEGKNKKNKALKPCPKCGKMYKNLSVHIKHVHKRANVYCPHTGCDKKLKTKHILSVHMKVVHSDPTTVCTNCGQMVKRLQHHLTICNPSKEQFAKRRCHICEKVLSCPLTLNNHIEGQHGEGLAAIECPDCGKIVKYIKQHVQSQHTEEDKSKQFKLSCLFEGCEKRFRTTQVRDVHYRSVHLNQRTSCTLCGKSIKNLDDHMRRAHKTGKERPCLECGKIFHRPTDLKVHTERVHEGLRYICPECGHSASKIRDHMKSAHGVTHLDKSNIKRIRTK